ERAPELHPGLDLAAPVPLEPAPRRGRVHEPALGERAGREDVARELAERAAQPAALGRHEAELVAALAHDRREEVPQRAPEHVLRPAAADQLAARQREAELDEAVVEERDTRLDRVRHGVAILVAK